jgi:hypothetical protein
MKVNKLYADFEKDTLSTNPKYGNFLNHFKAMLTLMNSNQRNLELEFKDAVKSVDFIRDENFSSTFPELKEMLD